MVKQVVVTVLAAMVVGAAAVAMAGVITADRPAEQTVTGTPGQPATGLARASAVAMLGLAPTVWGVDRVAALPVGPDVTGMPGPGQVELMGAAEAVARDKRGTTAPYEKSDASQATYRSALVTHRSFETERWGFEPQVQV